MCTNMYVSVRILYVSARMRTDIIECAGMYRYVQENGQVQKYICVRICTYAYEYVRILYVSVRISSYQNQNVHTVEVLGDSLMIGCPPIDLVTSVASLLRNTGTGDTFGPALTCAISYTSPVLHALCTCLLLAQSLMTASACVYWLPEKCHLTAQ